MASQTRSRPNGRLNGSKATELFPPFPDRDTAPPSRRLAGLIDSDDGSEEENGSSATDTSPVTSPVYWFQTHQRTVSNVSAESLLPVGAITLQDNEEETAGLGRDRNRACWAKSVEITDNVVVNGSATNIGAFVVWNIRVETLTVSYMFGRRPSAYEKHQLLWLRENASYSYRDFADPVQGSYMNIRKRYSEFDDLRRQLIFTFPNFEAAVPILPPKSVISKFRPDFLEKRRAGLEYFIK